jgi:hypothetical protein
MYENLPGREQAGRPGAAVKRGTEETRTRSQRVSTERVEHPRHPLDGQNERRRGQPTALPDASRLNGGDGQPGSGAVGSE